MSAAVGSLKSRVLSSGSWTIFGYGAQVALRMASTLIMTRLLLPEVFGIMAIAVIVQVIVALLADIGIQPTVVHSKRGADPAFLNTAWTLQIIRGLSIWLICVLVAAVVFGLNQAGYFSEESVYGKAVLPLVIVGMSFEAVVLGLASTKIITAHRDLNLRQVTLLEVFSHTISLIVMIAAGWYTRSIWAFVVGSMVHALLVCVLSHTWLPGERNRLQWEHASLQEFRNFGRWVLMSSAIFVIAANGDRLLLGGWTDAATLGLYAIAYTLAKLLADASEQFFSSVAMPAISEQARSDSSGLRKVYFGVRIPFDIMLLAGAGFLFSTGELIVEFLYDDRYMSAGSMLQAFSCMLIFSRYTMTCYAYLAVGEPRNFFLFNLVKLISVFAALPLAYWAFGIMGAVWAVALHLAPTVPLILWLNRKHNLNDFRYELLVLLVWPVGYLFGELTLRLVGYA